MENIVPGVLHHLRAADIIRMAGLAAASLGQEYNRTATITNTQRQNTCLRGTIEIPRAIDPLVIDSKNDNALSNGHVTATSSYSVEVEISHANSWASSCSCGDQGPMICVHAAALLYRWIAQPVSFELSVPRPRTVSSPQLSHAVKRPPTSELSYRERNELPPDVSALLSSVVVRYSVDSVSILTQIGLGELRSIARVYNLPVSGIPKQQLIDAIVTAMQKSENVLRIASTLEKPQRQFLAALILAGGLVSDEDAQGIFTRFSLGTAAELSRVLLALQGKALLFRTNALGNDGLSRANVSNTTNWLDTGWFVPNEVRSALHAAVPTTTFDITQPSEKYGSPQIQANRMNHILSDLCLLARAIDDLEIRDRGRAASEGAARSKDISGMPSWGQASTKISSIMTEHAVLVPAPEDWLSASLVAEISERIDAEPAFLRFAFPLLIEGGLITRAIHHSTHLQTRKDVVQVLLGSGQYPAILRDLFRFWLTRSSYSELFDLTEDGRLKLCCRSTSLHVPILRQGELEEENSQARQALIALIAQAPSQQWINFQGFARFVSRLTPVFLQRRQRLFPTPHWWFENEAGYPLKGSKPNDWQRVELVYVMRLITGPLYWWGICDVVRSEQGQLLAFRLTDLADWYFRDVLPASPHLPADTHESGSMMTMSTSQDILVPATIQNWPALSLFETFSAARGVRDGQLCYHVTPVALGAALSRGEKIVPFLSTLRQISTEDGPQQETLVALIHQIEQWLAGYGQTRLYTGVTLLETIDSMVMRELAATIDLDDQLVQTLQPTINLLKKGVADQLIEDLKRRGQSPLVHDEDVYGTE